MMTGFNTSHWHFLRRKTRKNLYPTQHTKTYAFQRTPSTRQVLRACISLARMASAPSASVTQKCVITDPDAPLVFSPSLGFKL